MDGAESSILTSGCSVEVLTMYEVWSFHGSAHSGHWQLDGSDSSFKAAHQLLVHISTIRVYVKLIEVISHRRLLQKLGPEHTPTVVTDVQSL